MKNRSTILAITIFFAFTSSTIGATLSNEPSTKGKRTNLTEEQKRIRLEAIEQRTHEIITMDKSQLSNSDKRHLRKELRKMNKEAKETSRGVYLSVGAIIIIILLLILLL